MSATQPTLPPAIAALDRLDHAAAELRMLFRTRAVSDVFHRLGTALLASDPVSPAVVAAALVAHLAVALDELKADADILAIEHLLKTDPTAGSTTFVALSRAQGLVKVFGSAARAVSSSR